jgi:uncharacterized protein with ParB-like and HNH nuclease domain
MNKNINNVNIESITLSELFQKKHTLTIPEYQRPYVWTKKDIKKLLNQIDEHQKRKVENKPKFYLGSIVLHFDGEKYNIIDGQQRLTSLQLLDYIKNKRNYLIKYSHSLSFKNIKQNFEDFKNEEFDLIDFDLINVTIVETQSEDMAYNFFETLNTGGKRLSGTDILKAHHLRSIGENEERNSYALNWEKNQKNLENVNRMLSKIRRMDYLNRHTFVPDKFTDDNKWKNILTEDFSEKVNKDNRDIGYSFVEIEENTHKITADKYAIRQPLNEGINYINYLLNFTKDYNYLFELEENKKNKYSDFNREIINVIDGTVDLRYYYQLTLLCFVDRFGRKNILEFSMYLFRFIYSLRLSDKVRIQESTVRIFIDETKIMERILNAFTYHEIITYLKSYELKITNQNLSGVKQRFYNRVNEFFSGKFTVSTYDKDLKAAIENTLNN